jgi:secreted trypsin-like serine protease
MKTELSPRAWQLSSFWACLTACSMFGCSSASTVESGLEPRRDAILGGRVDTTHSAVVAVRQMSGLCSGSVIDARGEAAWILTAAHCVVEIDDQGEVKVPVAVVEPSTVFATVGSDYASDLAMGAILPAVEIRIDPGYDGFPGNANDIALVRVLGNAASLMTLPWLVPASDDVREGEPVTLVGFGTTEDANNTQRHVTQQTVAWLDQHFIGIDQTNGMGVCHGDSGGPVLVVRNGSLTVAGVNSVGAGTRAKPCSQASTSTRIARFAELIANTLGQPSPPAAGGAPMTAGASGSQSGTAPTEAVSGGTGGASAATAGTHNDGGCSVSRSNFRSSPWRPGLLCLVGLALSLRHRRAKRTA